jgi:hypothetical protein
MEEEDPVRTPSNVNDSFELHPMGSEIELTPTDTKSEVMPVSPVGQSVDSISETGSSPAARVGVKVEPVGSAGSPASRPNLMIRIESA